MTLDRLLGSSPAIKTLRALISRIAPTEGRVLVTGENGTGKELVAEALHALSPRADKPFITLNCAAVPAELIESELFGHERGSFTGAHQRKIGKFEAANGGTLFLDEVGDMPLPMQAKLLRVLQTGEVVRVGSTTAMTADVRVFSATNKDLEVEVAEGRFREDLYYRLNVLPIQLPPLRARPTDIPELVAAFTVAAVARNRLPRHPVLTLEAMQLLAGHRFPGNIRELQNLVERLVILATSETMTVRDVQPWVPDDTAPSVEIADQHATEYVAVMLPQTQRVSTATATAEAPEPTATSDEPPHGTAPRYYSRAYRCRCDDCRAAYTAYRARNRNAQRSDNDALAFVAPVFHVGAKVVRDGVPGVITEMDDEDLLVKVDGGDDEDLWLRSEVTLALAPAR